MMKNYLNEMETKINKAAESSDLTALAALFDDVAETYKKSVQDFNTNLAQIYAGQK